MENCFNLLLIMDNYKILERIGEGTHGQVVQALEQSSGEIVAIKCVRSLDKTSKNLLREIESLKALESNYVRYQFSNFVDDELHKRVLTVSGCKAVG